MDIILTIKLVISTLLVLFLPGYFIYYNFFKKLNLDFFQSLMISSGISLSFIPLVTYFSTLIGIKLNSFLIIILFSIFGLTISLKYIFENIKNKKKFFDFERSGNFFKKNESSSYIILIIILIISLVVRLIPIKDILVAPGSDSYHHTLIVQLIIENGGIPMSYEPYAPFKSFTYHFGFHSIVAFIYWLSGIAPVKLVLYTGQVLNAFIVLSIYIFVDRLFKDRNMALVSSFIVGLISVFPAYLINWGRFTSLTGMLILPIALLLVIESFKNEKRDIPVLVLSGMVMTGLFLTHYRIIIAALSFLTVYVLYESYYSNYELKKVKEIISRNVVIGITSIILLLPWLFNLMNNSNLTFEIPNTINYYSLERIESARDYYSNILLLLFSLCGVLIGIYKKNKYIMVIFIWTLILIIFSNPYWIKLPVSGSLDFISVVTLLFFPVSVTSSYFIVYLLKKIVLIEYKRTIFYFIIIFLIIPFSSIKITGVFNSATVYIQEADIEAMDWIKTNTSEDALFLLNSYDIDWNRDLIIGIDSGYWIPLFTKRSVTIPPMTYLLERPIENNYIKKLIELSKAEESITSKSTIDFLIKNNVSYVYFGGRNWGKLKLQDLQNNPYLEPVYNKDGVWIFRIKPI